MTTSKYKQRKQIDWAKLPYFAFGSNLNLQQMALRCPGIINKGAAELNNWALTFRGVADIEERKNSKVYGALFHITPDHLRALDRYEGWPFLYVHRKVTVIDENGDRIHAFTYVMNEKRTTTTRPVALPGDWYFEVIREGFGDFGLPERALFDALKEVAHAVDLNIAPVRKGNYYGEDTQQDLYAEDEDEYSRALDEPQDGVALAF